MEKLIKVRHAALAASLFSMLTIITGCALLSEILNPNQPPIAIATCTQISPTTVEFDASRSYDPDGRIQSYEWDFGDGTYGRGPRVVHTYGTAGIYVATLTVTDDDGAQAKWRCTGIVIVSEITYTINQSLWVEEWHYVYWDLKDVTSLSFRVTASYEPVHVYVMTPENFSRFREFESFYYLVCGSSGGQDVWEFEGECWWLEKQRVFLVIFNPGDFDLIADDAFITVEGSYTTPLF